MASPTLRAARTTPTAHTALIEPVIEALNRIIIGKTRHLRLGVACLLARGHLLIEDVPGVGKTTLAHALAKALGLSYQRIQFTSDLAAGRHSRRLGFPSRQRPLRVPQRAGVLAARARGRDQPRHAKSAKRSARSDGGTPGDGRRHDVRAARRRFFVIATRNPAHQIGTFPLPESQLDRFLMQIELGYPAPSEERQLLANGERRILVEQLQPVLSLEALLRLQEQVTKVHVSEALLDYVQALIAYTRESGEFAAGLSPRAGIALVRAAQAWALMAGHGGIHPEDIQAVFGSIAAHRLQSTPGRSLAVRQRCRSGGFGKRSGPLSYSSLERRAANWARRRQGPDPLGFTLRRRRIYILPTRFGAIFGALVFAMLLGSLNYGASLGFVLTFLLGSLALVAMHHCHNNLLGTHVQFAGARPVFAGERAEFRIAIGNEADVAAL